MGSVISRVFGGRKEDSKTEVREPKHRKRWSFRAARRNDEQRVNVPTRSSTMPARAHQRTQNEPNASQTHESAEFEKMPQGQRTEFEEIDEATVANRVQEILKEVADDDETPVPSNEPVQTKQESEPNPSQPVETDVKTDSQLVEPADTSALISATFKSEMPSEIVREVLEVQSQPVEQERQVTQSHEGNSAAPVEIPKPDEQKEEQPKVEEVEAVIQEQSHTVSAEVPDHPGLDADQPATEQHVSPTDESQMHDKPVANEYHEVEEPKTTEEVPPVNVEEAVGQTVLEHTTEQENVASPNEMSEHGGEQPKMEEINVPVQEEAEPIHVQDANLVNFENQEPAATTEERMEQDMNSEEQITTKEEHENVNPDSVQNDDSAAIQEAKELVEQVLGDSENMPEDAGAEHNPENETNPEATPDQEHPEAEPVEKTVQENPEPNEVHDEQGGVIIAGTQDKPEETSAELVDNLKTESESTIDNEHELEPEHQLDDSTVGAFVDDILHDAKQEVQIAMVGETNQNAAPQETNETHNENHEGEQHANGEEASLADGEFVEKLVSSVSDPEQDQLLPNHDGSAQDNTDFPGEKPEKILEKTLNPNGDEPPVSNDQLVGSVTNGYQE